LSIRGSSENVPPNKFHFRAGSVLKERHQTLSSPRFCSLLLGSQSCPCRQCHLELKSYRQRVGHCGKLDTRGCTNTESDVATFDISSVTELFNSTNMLINGVVFNLGARAYPNGFEVF